MDPKWHFPIMIVASLFVFFAMVRLVLTKVEFYQKLKKIFLLGFIVVVLGMLFGKYGAAFHFPWWLYYPIPMLATVILPPIVLKLNTRKTAAYLLLSFLSAPFIHFIFSFGFGRTEYMPFWSIPYIGDLISV